MVGDKLKLTCKVNKVTTDVKWKKDGVLVSSRARISPRKGDKNILFIENVEKGDSGDYTCEASNEAGIISHSSFVQITVGGKVYLIQQYLHISGAPAVEGHHSEPHTYGTHALMRR